jgi:dTDP-4-dehydrorhamnose 3,5-epimerase-like enzyme
MAKLLKLHTHTDPRGSLTVLDQECPFTIKRIFWIYDLNDQVRGQHRHHHTRQILVCLQGSCEVYVKKGSYEATFQLDVPNLALLLEPEDWHEMRDFKERSILLVASSHAYDPQDYIMTPLDCI